MTNKDRKAKYNEIHSSIREVISYEGDEILSKSNLAAFTSIKYQPQDNDNGGNDENNVLQVKCFKTPLPSNLHEQCMNLFQMNMKTMYEKSSWGLDLDEKSSQLSHDNARFLIVTRKKCNDDDDNDDDNNDEVVAFTHFRFECSVEECNDHNCTYCKQTSWTLRNDKDAKNHQPILYLYEIQIDPRLQRQNIGKKLMTMTQIIAMKMKMTKVILTVFKFNNQAMDFYKKKLGYKTDESSPDCFIDDGDDEEVDYVILSKVVQVG